MGEPDEPFLVLQLCINSLFLSIDIFNIVPYETDKSDSGYWIIYTV